MSFNLNWKGSSVLVFFHGLDIYVLIPHDLSIRDEIVKSEHEILKQIQSEFGNELNSLTLVQTYLH